MVVVVALIVSIGGHWALLQSAAWVGMFATNVRSCSVTEALEKTFDGQHPCPLCKVIAAGKKTEQKQTLVKIEIKHDFCLESYGSLLIAPRPAGHLCVYTEMFQSRLESPPTPPPRSA